MKTRLHSTRCFSPTLRPSPGEIYLAKAHERLSTCQQFTNWGRWNKLDIVWSSANSRFLKLRFRSRLRRCIGKEGNRHGTRVNESNRSFLSGPFVNSLYLQPTTEQEIIEICSSFRAETAEGYDQITLNVIIQIIDLTVQPLTYITNLPLIKFWHRSWSNEGSPSCSFIDLSRFTNYRPVSVLPAFSR